jgi:MFS family permease
MLKRTALAELSRDGWLLFATRTVRLFAYGLMSVVLVLYLASIGLSDTKIGLLITLTLWGDVAISLVMSTSADRLGRRKMLLLGAVLMLLAGAVFALSGNFVWLIIAATIGVISPTGNEVGPFLAIEQAALSQTVNDHRRTDVFAWYNLVGSFATAIGSLCGGAIAQWGQTRGMTDANSYRMVVWTYGAMGIALAMMFLRLSPTIEAHDHPADEATHPRSKRWLGLGRSRNVVLRLSGLFALDAFAGGFVMQSLIAYWFHLRFGVEPALLGTIFLFANLLAGVSALMAGVLARQFGLVNTMVFTHLPSNLLLILVPLMPNLWSAVTILLLRFSISQMDVPTRQAYTMAVVHPSERSSANGVTAVARSIGASLSPPMATRMIGIPTIASLPFFVAGAIKILYDLLLYRSFTETKQAQEERPNST